jgi:hypothetical protein
MSNDVDTARREAAEMRVREKHAQQMASLIQWQEEQRRADFRAQKQVLDQNTAKEAALTESHRLAMERLERGWQQQRDRLACVPGPAPSYGLLPPPQKDIKSDYDRAREQYVRSKDALAIQFEKDLTDCHRERADQLQAFQKANDARECGFEEDRQIKAAEQQRGFEILVHRQMQRPERSAREEFARNSRDTERHI